MKPPIVWLSLLILALPLQAEETPVTPAADPQTPAEWNALREQGQQMQAQAGRLRTEAQAAHATAERTCWKKFLVSDCLEDARQAQRDAEREARRLEVEAGRIERRITEHERRERIARKQAEKQAEIEQQAQRRQREQLPAGAGQ
jgi:hypothetical protein